MLLGESFQPGEVAVLSRELAGLNDAGEHLPSRRDAAVGERLAKRDVPSAESGGQPVQAGRQGCYLFVRARGHEVEDVAHGLQWAGNGVELRQIQVGDVSLLLKPEPLAHRLDGDLIDGVHAARGVEAAQCLAPDV